MNRRQFLARSGIALGVAVGTAGCTGASEDTPPRESEVFESITATNSQLTVALESQPVVQSRQNLSEAVGRPAGGVSGALADLSPVGVASGAETTGTEADPRGRGNADAAPRSRNGRAKWRGGDHEEWWDENGDDVDEYNVSFGGGGFFFYGSTEEFRQNLPGPGPLDWAQKINSVERDELIWQHDVSEGWYRVGIELLYNDDSLGWEAVDFQVQEVDQETTTAENETDSGNDEPSYEVVTEWKVSATL